MTLAWRVPHRRDIAADRELRGHAAWYVAAGVVTTGLQAALFSALEPHLGAQPANLVAIAVTTAGNTEFHRRVTFAGRRSQARRRHFQDLMTFAFYAAYGSAVLLALDATVGHPAKPLQTLTLVAASTVGGVVRFAVLRWWVFARRVADPATGGHTVRPVTATEKPSPESD